MSHSYFPVRQHLAHQEDLIWWANESDGALGRKSIQGSIQSRLEGGAGVYEAHDLEVDMKSAFDEIIGRKGFRAAGRLKMIQRTWLLLTKDDQKVLASIYWTPVHKGLEAFGRLANMVVLSKTARKGYEASGTLMTFGEWVTRLSARRVGAPLKGGGRSVPKVTLYESNLIVLINRENMIAFTSALENYAESYRRVEIDSL